jgi:hypothetical protein
MLPHAFLQQQRKESYDEPSPCCVHESKRLADLAGGWPSLTPLIDGQISLCTKPNPTPSGNPPGNTETASIGANRRWHGKSAGRRLTPPPLSPGHDLLSAFGDMADRLA